MRASWARARIGIIGALSVAALAIAGLYRSSGPAYSAAPAPTLFITDDCSSAVTAYPAASNGDVSPLAPAPITGLFGPRSVAFDKFGNIYVTNACHATITIYAKGTSGNTAPIASIGGSSTGLFAPIGIALDSSGNIYVTGFNVNTFNPSLFVYPPLGSSTGMLNEAPTAVIGGSNTGLNSPEGIALDSSGHIYVTDFRGSVFVYPALGASTGLLNEAPAATISGSNTGLGQPAGIALDSSEKIYVADPFADSVFIYPALGSSTGLLNEAPTATIAGSNTGLIQPFFIGLDSSGNIYVTDDDASSVFVYPALGSSSGLLNEAPTATISGSNTNLINPQGIALDSSRNMYVAEDLSSSVFVYPAVGSSTGLLDEAPSAAISASFTTGLRLPLGIAIDSSGKVYVAADGFGFPSVFVYPAGSNANTAPIATISGSNTGLEDPQGIALDSSGNIYVANGSTSSVLVYPALRGSTGLLNEAPTAYISGSNTGLSDPIGIALDPSGNIYVADSGAAAVLVYPALGSSTGFLDEAPTAAISGSNTSLVAPFGIALDSSCNIYIGDNGAISVFVYPALGSSTGMLNEAPTATISGSNTGLNGSGPEGIALDSSGNIYVAAGFAASVFVYPAGSAGNVTPIATISGPQTQLDEPQFIAIQNVESVSTPTPTATASATATPTATATPSLGRIKVKHSSLTLKAKTGKHGSGDIVIENKGKGPLTVDVEPLTLNLPFTETGGGSGIFINKKKSHKVKIEYSPPTRASTTTSVTITSDDPTHPNPIVVTIKGEK
jgi:sugar lactone lactonase YvrE